MARVLVRDGFHFNIYRRDAPPAHVHVKRGSCEAIIGLLPPHTVLENWGFSEAEIVSILEIVERRAADFLRGHWDRYHLER
jgi:hypothetical protein